MTDQNPGQTQRMPVPPAQPDQEGGLGTTASPPEPNTLAAPPPPPSPPVPPLAPPPQRESRDRGRSVSILFGLMILGLGLWFFAEHTLGYQLPRIRWSQLWPVFIIGIGLWVVLGSMRRGTR